jgi:hypothetical protein
MKRTLVVFGVLVLVALLAADIYLRLSPRPDRTPAAPTPSPTVATATATPEATPAPEVVVEETSEVVETPVPEVVADAGAPGSTAPGSKPPGQRRPPKKRRTAAPTAKPVKPAPPAPAVRTFVNGATRIEGEDGPYPDTPTGFDAGGVAVKRAPKVDGRIEFDVQPAQIKAGDPYLVRIYLRNEGKKAIKVKQLRMASSLNGSRSEAALTPRIKEVPAGSVGLMAEAPSVWKKDVTSWSIEVTVKSGHGEVYRNSVTWK